MRGCEYKLRMNLYFKKRDNTITESRPSTALLQNKNNYTKHPPHICPDKEEFDEFKTILKLTSQGYPSLLTF